MVVGSLTGHVGAYLKESLTLTLTLTLTLIGPCRSLAQREHGICFRLNIPCLSRSDLLISLSPLLEVDDSINRPQSFSLILI